MKHIFLIPAVFFSVATAAMAATGTALITGTGAGSKIGGVVTFTEANGGLTIQANVVNAPPGQHGIHLHENASCAEGGKAAGGHFNPDKVAHGYLPKDGKEHAHAGDMGNIAVDAQGKGSLSVFMPGLTLGKGEHSVAGKSVILHEKSDDFGQPTGNAGGRIGCGVIEVVGQ
ncbi:MAG: superoxide dismutase family protein [Candidatus Omnitrophota bacterium]